jgi:hypothetical protein
MVHHAGLSLRGGDLSFEGRFELAPRWRWVELDNLTLDRVVADYLYGRDQVIQAAANKATESGPTPSVYVDRLELHQGDLGVVDETADPHYRVFVDQAEVIVRNVSIPSSDRQGSTTLKGRFMGSGDTLVKATFRPGERAAVEGSVRIEPTPLTALNDVLRAYGDFDVTRGEFELYTELSVRGTSVEGYVKPIIHDMDVYDSEQDAEKGIFKKAYEAIVGAGATVLRNQPRDQVATRVPISGRLDDPNLSTVQAIVGLVRNAFIEAIRPGLEQNRAARR